MTSAAAKLPELPGPSDQLRLQRLARDYVVDYPDLHDLANSAAQKILFQHTGQHLDPDKVYWHRFGTAISSPRSFTGWQHASRPIESMTLVQLLLHRFNTHDQQATDELQLYGGFYTDDAEHERFDERNEVRLLPQDVLRDFWALDFSSAYRAKMATFWERHSETFSMLAKASFLVDIANSRASQTLLPDDLHTLSSLMPNLDAGVSTLAWLQTPVVSNPQASVRYLELGRFKARDILRIVSAQGRQILYIPGHAMPFQCFDGAASLYTWLKAQFFALKTRTQMLDHFLNPVAASQEDSSALRWSAGLLIVSDQQPTPALVNAEDQPIPGDPFFYLRDVAREEMTLNADTLLTSNGDLRKRIWIGYLNAFLQVFANLGTMAWPLALTGVGASIASVGLNIDQAISAKTSEQRRQGVFGAISSVVYLFINLPLLEAMKEDSWAARLAADDNVTQVNTIELIPISPTSEVGSTVSGSSSVSSSSSAFPATPLPPAHSVFWDTYMQLDPINEARYATDALVRQKAVTSMFQLQEAQESIATDADQDVPFDQWAVRHDVSPDPSTRFGSMLRDFTANEAAYNQFLRTGVPYFSDQIENIQGLAKEITALGYNNEATLYRGGRGRTGILGTAFSSGRVKAGDVLVSTEFTLFNENPYSTRLFVELHAQAVPGTAVSPVTFDDTSVVFVLPERQYLHGTPIAPFSAHPDQAELVFLPGRYFQIDNVEHLVGAFYSFVKVQLREVHGPLPGRSLLDLRTGEPFTRERYAATLGPAGASLVDQFMAVAPNP